MISRIKINSNNTIKSIEVEKTLRKKLENTSYIVVEDNPDLIISIGGDGSFLRTLRDNNFNDNPIYVGINSGHLGFLQEVKIEEIDLLLNNLNNNEYKIEELTLIETDVLTSSSSINITSLNEIVIRKSNLNTIHFDLYINSKLYEHFCGDGKIICSPIGSTAYNLSSGGSIIYPTMEVLQITPISALNSKAYRSLPNSVVVQNNMEVIIVPNNENDNDNILLIHDGVNKYYEHVNEIKVKVSDKKIKTLRFNNYDFWEIIKEKFL